MRQRIRTYVLAGLTSVVLAAVLFWSTAFTQAQKPTAAAPQKLRFEITVTPGVHQGPINGRVYVMVTRTIEKVPEPRLQIGRTGVPFFGRDVERLSPDHGATIDESDLGTPLESIALLPPGDYYVQAMVNVYSEFHRADGHVV
jgi:hypothetical protein